MTEIGQAIEQKAQRVTMSLVGRQARPGKGYFTVSAPVGQASTQLPQLMQFVSTRGSFIAGRTSVWNPRPTRPRAEIGSTRAQVRMQRAQRMHLLGS